MGFWDALGEFAGTQFVDDRAKTLVDRGIRCHNEGRYQEAVENYKAATAIEHDYVDPHHFLANTYGQLERFADAFGEYRIALSLAQEFLPETTRKRAIELIMHNLSLTIAVRRSSQDSYRHAANDFKKICGTLKRPPPFYHAILGQIYDDLGLGREAIGEFEKFLAKDKDAEITDLIHAKIEKIQAQDAGRTCHAHGTSQVSRAKKKWWQLWKRESPGVYSQDNPTGNTVSKESKQKTVEGKIKKCVNCSATIPEDGLQCSACGSSRFIWE